MAKLIVLFGPQQVGKSTAAESLCYNEGFKRVAFADPLYEMLGVLLGLPGKKVKKLPKETPVPELSGKTIRYALQSLGTEWGRELMGPDFWVNKACLTIGDLISHGHSVVVDDCRFLSEYDAMAQAGATFVSLQRADLPEQSNPKHGSEIEWKQFKAFCAVFNDAPTEVEWLENASRLILEAIEDPTRVAQLVKEPS